MNHYEKKYQPTLDDVFFEMPTLIILASVAMLLACVFYPL